MRLFFLVCFFCVDLCVFAAEERATAWVALKRIYPGEKLIPEFFKLQEVDVSQGWAKEVRTDLLPKEINLSQLEARQSILEGQFALLSGVQKIPDIKRGERVQVRLISGGVALSTSATAEEPAYVHGSVHVMTGKTKRVLVGVLLEDKSVEVKL